VRDETSGRLRGPVVTGRVGGLLYGGDYNPEQWPETVWRSDVQLMREAGVNLVTVAVFAWARLEPEPGSYRFDWLDQLLDLLHRHGIAADLATATASPPAWLARRHPESLPVTAEGVTLWPGSRQHFCPSSRAYREAAGALVERLAERYAEHPALAMWHVGNEYGCHVSACWCDASAAAFRGWLRRRYETLERLNQAWGTEFWSQRYGDWEEIVPPRRTPTFPNPAQELDFRRFSSDALLERFAQGGGTLAVTFASGLVDEHDQVNAHGYLGLLGEVLGVTVDEIVPMAEDGRQAVVWNGRAYSCRDLCDVLTVRDATTVASFADDFYTGRAALTRRVAGTGTAWYVAARPGPELATALVEALCLDAGVRPGPWAGSGVEAVRREHAERRFLFLLNHGAEAAEVPLPAGCRSLLDGGRELGQVTLEPGGVAVLEEAGR
jgi:beta-galactosidase GanA